ncbi:MAG: hypothetical protein C5B51_14935 [Terriglobia bacterium]|nr:MAG: hypothetical protein C5B51_14935 [Terriglobia bacterium]
MKRWRIYEYLEGDESTIGIWLREQAISARDRGQLMQKMDMLAQNGMDLHPGLLAGPIASKRKPKMQSNIYKLIIHGQRMLRPMLCRGPIDMDGEFTMLLGAVEKGGVLDADAEDAQNRRQEIIDDPQGKRRLNGRYR